MPLTLVLGPANSAKAGEVLGAYADAAHRGALLVVPTALDADHYTRQLAGQGSVLGSVLTFAGLAGEIARRTGYGGRRLTALQRERVVHRAVRGARLQSFGRAARSPGFVSAAGALVAELERSLVTPQRFAQACGGDVATVYLAYSRELERLGRVDGELYAWRALDALRTAPGAWGSTAVFFYGFDDLHPLERDAIETLARVVGAEVTVSLTYEPGRAALEARAHVAEELKALAERVVELPALDEHYEPSSRAVLHHVERALFEPSPERVDPGAAVRLLEAGGERAEAELVAAEVLALLGAGVAGEEIAVVYRSLSRSGAVLERVFHQYGIPVAIERQVPFGHAALGRGVLALARCALLAEDQARPEDLLDYLRSPGVLDHPEIADGVESDVRREGMRTAAQARERLGWRLHEIDAVRTSTDQAAELARQGRRLLAAGRRGAVPLLDAAEQIDARALTVMLRALGELEELSEAVSGAELIELLEGLQVPAGSAPRPGAVLVTDPLAIRARRFRAVFVCGLVEGEFPTAGAPDPFLSDERRRELAASSGLWLQAVEDSLARERYLFYACVSRATERVTLSYRSSDEEGNIALPSPFVADVADVLQPDWSEQRRRRLIADVVWPAAQAPTARELERSHAAAAASPDGLRRFSLSEVALRRVRHREIVSGGALEAFADCPVRWLVERELQPAELRPDPDPMTRGNYMHTLLEELLRRLGRAVSADSLPEAMRIVDELLAELPAPIAPGRTAAIRAAALKSIAADLRRYLRHEAADEGAWEPRELELRFGFEGEEEQASLPALELGAGVRVRGIIDRVDVDSSGHAIVRDYKSGGMRPEYQGGRWRTDRRLQVALYMLAVGELLGLEPVAGLYQPLGGGDLRGRGLYLKGAAVGSRLYANDGRGTDELQAELEDACSRAVELATRLRSGQLEPCPQTCSRQGCRYPGICRA